MKINYTTKTLALLKELYKSFPNQPLSTHIAFCFPDLLSLEGISDKTLFTQLEEYKAQKDLDIEIPLYKEEYFDISSLEEEEDF